MIATFNQGTSSNKEGQNLIMANQVYQNTTKKVKNPHDFSYCFKTSLNIDIHAKIMFYWLI